MPREKRTEKTKGQPAKTSKKVVVKESPIQEQELVSPKDNGTSQPKAVIGKYFNFENIKKYRPSRRDYFVILIIGLLLIAYYKKSWIIAATVNGSPVTNYELMNRMNQQYHDQILNQMINEKIVLDEAHKNGINISDSDINQKISQIEAGVGGPQVLDNLLAQQGQSRSSLKEQVRMQLTIEKLYDKDATVSSEEVTQFIATNKDQLQSTDSAEQIKEATELLKQQKISQIFGSKFQQLKQQSSIHIF